jgi:excisionase family DNA binding protein
MTNITSAASVNNSLKSTETLKADIKKQLIEEYGLTMTTDQLCEVLKIKTGTLYHQIAQNRLEITYRKIGKSYLFLTPDVADYLVP